MKLKILVTGGAGYIGSHFVNLLKSYDCDVTVLDNLSTGRKESVLVGDFIQQDLGDYSQLDSLMERRKFDSVVHFAGSIVVPESVTNPVKYYHNNSVHSLKLIELSVKHGVRNFIFSSTAAVYGITQKGECDEQTLLNPINPYGRSKLITEMMLEDVARATNLNFIALRYFNVAGANIDGLLGQCTPNATHLIKVACEVALKKKDAITIYGSDYETKDGTCVRDYIHVDDLARAHINALEFLKENNTSHVLNCGYGQGYSVREVVQVVKEISGNDFKVFDGNRRDGDTPYLIAVSDKIKSVLGWKPQHNDLSLIVETALNWESKI